MTTLPDPKPLPVTAVEPTGGAATRTRLRVTEAEAAVLEEVAELYGGLYRRAFAARNRAGTSGLQKAELAALKRELTVGATSRYAGTAIRAAKTQWSLARRAARAEQRSLRAGVATIERKLRKPVGVRGGYRTQGIHAAKTQRLQVLQARLRRAEERYDSGHVRVVHGGRTLLGNRHNLAAAGLTETEWRRQWHAERDFIEANGGKDEPFGNLTITVTPDGRLSLRLPAALEHLANAPRGRFAFSEPVGFKHLHDRWVHQIQHGAVSYKIERNPANGGWYVSASWSGEAPVLAPASRNVIAIDMNRDHLAAIEVDEHGNPVGDPRRFLVATVGSTGHRDAVLRHSITQLIHWAATRGVTRFVIEDLEFSKRRTRESGTRGYRRMIHGFPTTKFKELLVRMAAKAGIRVETVDPAWSSALGRAYWTDNNRTVHEAAAIVIGRRAQGHHAARRLGVTRNGPVDPFVRATSQARRGDRPARSIHPPGQDPAPAVRERFDARRDVNVDASGAATVTGTTGSYRQVFT